MPRTIIVNAGISETRVAVLDGGLLTDLSLERRRHRSIVGSVYKGVVTNVLPGMQAAFVDVGLLKDGFLYAGDFTANVGDYERLMLAEDEADADIDLGEPEEAPERERREVPPIEDVLRKGQEILVQVSKESLGTKGARITSFISLPGRYLVYMPQVNHVGVSRRIRDAAERDRLRRLVKALRPATGGGFIIRTVGEGKGEEEFRADIEFLVRLWQQIQARFAQAPPRSPIHEEGDLIFRVVRDLFTADVDEILIDSEEEYRRALEYAQSLVPAFAHRVRLYEGQEPVFDARGIEREIEKALRRKVWLKSGGYLVFDQTEALVSIDVNTGKYVGKRDFEETILKINLEAVTEVVRQIRLRDLGGIIIIDFIDMEREEHRQQVFRALKRALAEDKSRTNVLEISELGLVEMTRKRVRQGLHSLLMTHCPTCKGTGVVKSPAAITAEIYRKIQAAAADVGGQEVLIRVNPEMALHFQEEEAEGLEALQRRIQRKVTVQAAQALHKDEYEIITR
ncbi:MAG TPA: Rne/Rng family ribonuclease [Methylomirabilota bacterium]|jgi:ribonuclease G|nr:Rne/Rng family ribonuclease [Methylomirabilota bacterium]